MIRGGSTLGLGRIVSGDAGRIDSGADRLVSLANLSGDEINHVGNSSLSTVLQTQFNESVQRVLILISLSIILIGQLVFILV